MDQGNALDQAISNVSKMLSGAGNAITQGAQGVEQGIGNTIQGAENFFNPQASGQNGFWNQNNPLVQGMTSPIAQGLESYTNNQIIQPIAQGAQQFQQNNNVPGTFGLPTPQQALNQGIGAMRVGQGVFSATPAGLAFNAANSGLTTAAQYFDQGNKNVAQNFGQNLVDPTKDFAKTGLGLDPNQHPLLSGAADLTANIAAGTIAGGLQGISSKLFGPSTSIFGKASDAVGGGDAGQGLMGRLFDKFGTDSYRFMANKDLIQRVVTGQASPEDLAQFQILNNLGLKGTAARAPGGISIEDTGTRIPKTGPVWDFLQQVFPNSFEGGAPHPDFTDPQKSPLTALPQMQLTPEENDALMKVDERNPSPVDQQVEKAKGELQGALPQSAGEMNPDQFNQSLMQRVKQTGIKSLTTEEQQYFMKNMDGTALLKAKPGATMGDLQRVSQTQRGVPLLADYDEATRTQNPELAQKIKQAIINMPDDSPYAPYRDQFKNLATPQSGGVDLPPPMQNAPIAPKFNPLESGKINFGAKIGLPKSVDELFGKTPEEAPDLKQAISPEVVAQHPDIAQYSQVLKKAARSYAQNPIQDIGTLTRKVPGLDIALQEMKAKGLVINSAQDLRQVAKAVPKQLVSVNAPKTSVEAMAAKNGLIPTVQGAPSAEAAVTPADIKQYAPEFQTPQGQSAVKGIINATTMEKPQLDSTFKGMAQQNQGEFTSRVKNDDTLIKKIVTKRKQGRDYSPFDVNDTYGSRITVPNAQAKSAILDQMQALSKSKQGGFDILNVENVKKDTYNATHIDFKTLNGTRGELQIVTPQEKAEALVNHPIRAMFGETPPEAVNKVKVKNANLIKNMTPAKANQLAKSVEAAHQVNPESAATQPLDLSKMSKVASFQQEMEAGAKVKSTLPTETPVTKENFVPLKTWQTIPDGYKIPAKSGAQVRVTADGQQQVRWAQKDLAQFHAPMGGSAPSGKLPERELPGVLQSTDELRAKAGLPTPPGQLKNPGSGSPLIPGDLPPHSPYNKPGIGALMQNPNGASQPLPGMTKPYVPGKLGLLKNNIIPEINVLKKSNNPHAQLLAQRIEGRNGLYKNLANTYKTVFENLQSTVKDSDPAHLFDVIEGKADPVNPAEQNFLQGTRTLTQDVGTKAQALGLKILRSSTGELTDWTPRSNYAPHYLPPEVYKAMQNDPEKINQLLDDMIKNGYAKDRFEAQIYANKIYGPLQNRRVGNLEMSREDNKVPYIKDPNVFLQYFDDAARRISDANYFGTFSQDSQRLIDNMTATGDKYLADTAHDLMQRYVGGNKISPEAAAIKDIAGPLHSAQTVMKLGPLTTPLHHAPVIPEIAARTGLMNTLKASGEGIKGALGQFDDLTRENVSRVHQNQSNLIYGNTNSVIDKWHSVIGLSRTLNALSAVGAHAANFRLNEIEGDLTNPKWIDNLNQAGLDGQTIAARGKILPNERTQYINSVLRDVGLVMDAGDMPKWTNSPLGKMASMFQGPLIQKTFRFYPQIMHSILKGGASDKGAAVAGLIGMLATGVGEQVTGNILANRPADKPGSTLYKGAIRGFAPVGLSQIADMIQYPEYAGQTAAGIIGGPNASDLYNAGSTLSGLQSNDPFTKLSAQRNLVRAATPGGLGNLVANTFLPYSSYKGNRPSDIVPAIAKGQPVTHGAAPFDYQVTPTAADLVRPNPTVATQSALAGNIAQAKQAILGKLDTTGQNLWNTSQDLLTKAITTGNPFYKIQAYNMIQNDPAVLLAHSQYQVYSEKQSGQPINPLWSLGLSDPAAQKVVMQYKAALPADQKAFKSDPNNAAVLGAYNAMEADYYQQLAKSPGGVKAAAWSIQPPPETQRVKDLLAQAKATKNYNLYDDPDVVKFFAAYDTYDTFINTQAGMPTTTGTSGAGGKSPYSSTSSYTQQGTANYMDRAMQRSYMAAAIKQAIQAQQAVPVSLPKAVTKPIGANYAAFQQKGAQRVHTALPVIKGINQDQFSQMPNLAKVNFKAPTFTPISLRNSNITTIG